nr:MAG TPA: hypothetical protein [Inoviridae sp.]
MVISINLIYERRYICSCLRDLSIITSSCKSWYSNSCQDT